MRWLILWATTPATPARPAATTTTPASTTAIWGSVVSAVQSRENRQQESGAKRLCPAERAQTGAARVGSSCRNIIRFLTEDPRPLITDANRTASESPETPKIEC